MAEKFEAALRNGYWVSRRNATVAILAEMQAEARTSSSMEGHRTLEMESVAHEDGA